MEDLKHARVCKNLHLWPFTRKLSDKINSPGRSSGLFPVYGLPIPLSETVAQRKPFQIRHL
jgi:hypothetical protein